MSTRTALVMAGGTGGHIFPGLAVAEVLRSQGWRVHWLGAPAPSMESQLVPAKGFAFEAVRFGGVRGKGLLTLALLPMRLLQAFWQSLQVIRRLRPDVLVGLGGYITFPGGMMGVLMGKPLVLHEQNSVAGMANKVLAHVADRVLCTFPKVLPKALAFCCLNNFRSASWSRSNMAMRNFNKPWCVALAIATFPMNILAPRTLYKPIKATGTIQMGKLFCLKPLSSRGCNKAGTIGSLTETINRAVKAATHAL